MNAAAKQLTRSRSTTHIIPILSALHWLPWFFSHRALQGQAPEYILDLFHLYIISRSLGSSNQGLHLKQKVIVPLKWWLSHGGRLFSVDLHCAVSTEAFKKKLKTNLFKLAFLSCVVYCSVVAYVLVC